MPISRILDTTFFKKWSPEMAYVLGYIEADGAITKGKRGNQYLDLYSIDHQLLFDIRATLKSNHKISTRNSNPNWNTAYRLQIGSASLINDLKRLGLCSAKSHRLVMPKVPLKYIGDFVRGYFDGDGNVAYTTVVRKNRKTPSKHLHCAFTSCSKNFLQCLRDVLQKSGMRGGSLYFAQKAYRLLFGLQDSIRLQKLMYQNKQSICLVRKRLSFEKAIRQYTNSNESISNHGPLA